MKHPGKWILVLALALAGGARGADGGAPGHYSGRAVDEHGQPVAGATVECYVDSSPASFYTAQDFALKERGTTDRKGGFTVSIGGGVTIVVVKKDGLAPGWRTFASVLDESTDPVVLTGLASPARSEVDANGQLISYSAPVSYALEGKVVDENGGPVAGADVWVTMAMPLPGGVVPAPVVQPGADPLVGVAMPALPGGEFSQRSMIFGKPARDCFSARTGADGRFRIANFPGNTQANLAVHKSGMALVPPANVGQGGRVAGFGFIIPGIINNPGNIVAPPPYMTGQNVNMAAASLQHDLMPWLSGQLNIELVLQRAGNIEGKVIVQETDKSIPGVKLIPLTLGKGLSGLQMPEPVLSGADGSFRIADVVPGMMTFGAVCPGDLAAGWAARDVSVTVVAGGTTKGIQVVAERCAIAGTVRDPDGRPVAGAKVALNPGGMGVEAVSDARGRYEATWDVSRGGYESFGLLARHTDRHLAAGRIIDASSTNFDLNLLPSVTIIAKLQDPGGKPVTNASANFAFHEGEKAGYLGEGTSDAEGRIEFPEMPVEERYSINLCPTGYGCVNQYLQLRSRHGIWIEFPIVLRPANQKLAGQVLGPDGKPIGGASVFFGGEGQANGNTVSDDAGHFSFDYASEGALWVSSGIQMNGYRDSGKIRAQGGDTNVVIPFAANGQENGAPVVIASGRVLDASGAPVSGARLSILPVNNGNVIELTSDSDGRYSILWVKHNVWGGSVIPFIYAFDPQRHLAVARDVDENTTNLDLRLEPALRLSVKVRDALAAPISGATASLSCSVGTHTFPIGSATATDDQGLLEFKDLPQGRDYAVQIAGGDYGSLRLEAKPEETKTEHFEFAPLVLKLGDRKLAGQVLGPDGKPKARVSVTSCGTGQPRIQSITDGAGHFAFATLHEGPVQLYVGNPVTGGTEMCSIFPARIGDTNAVINLGIITSGKVFDSGGKPAAGMQVRLWGDAWNRSEVKTDSEGRYSITWQRQQGNGVKPFIFAHDLEHNLAAAHELEETETNLDLALQPGLTLSVKLQDASGEPIRTATADLSICTGYGQFHISQVSCQPDERGVIEISGLPQERHYSVRINANDYRSVTLDAPASDMRAGRFDFRTVVLKGADRRTTAHEP